MSSPDSASRSSLGVRALDALILKAGPEISGLRPAAGLLIPTHFNQEEIKELLLEKGYALGPYAVMHLEHLAQAIIRQTEAEYPKDLSTSLSIEVIKRIVSASNSGDHFPQLRQKAVYRKQLQAMARALERGRRLFAHFDEAGVMLDRLRETERTRGQNPDRPGGSSLFGEFLKLRVALESWQREQKRWDIPFFYAQATEQLLATSLPWERGLPRRWILISDGVVWDPIEEHFINALCAHAEVVRWSLEDAGDASSGKLPSRCGVNAHTLDDAADALAFCLLEDAREKRLQQSIVLFNGSAELRRSLNRALITGGLEQLDPRDPDAVTLDPLIRKSLLPLQLLAQRCAKDSVREWIVSVSGAGRQEKQEWLKQIEHRGVRGKSGIQEFRECHAQLGEALHAALGGFPRKGTASAWAVAHLRWVEAWQNEAWRKGKFLALAQAWEELQSDLACLLSPTRTYFASFIWDRLQKKLAEVSPPVPRSRPRGDTQGVRIYRLGQIPVRGWKKLYFFGLNAADLDRKAAAATHDEWFRKRLRDRLGVDFTLPTDHAPDSPRALLLRSLRNLIVRTPSARGEVLWIDAHYDHAGKERESNASLLSELGESGGLARPPELIGSHPGRLASYSTQRDWHPAEIHLAWPAESLRSPGGIRLSTTAVENYSKCPFLGLISDRWKIRDVEAADLELPAHQQGIFLHEIVRKIVAFLDAYPDRDPDLMQLMDEVWAAQRPQAILRGERLERLAKAKLIPILQNFLAGELEYREKAPSRRVILDDTELKFSTRIKAPFRFDGVPIEIKAKPDRVDALPLPDSPDEEGLWIIDYKSGKNTPNGRKMREGFRLQLPIYALAARAHFKKTVMGAQFVQLHRDGKRTDGIFFSRFNGPEPGQPTQLTGRSHSLFSDDPEAVWDELNERIRGELEKMMTGDFSAAPKRPQETCARCRARVACGVLRRTEADEEGEGANE